MAFLGGHVELTTPTHTSHFTHFIWTRSIWITQIHTDVCLYATILIMSGMAMQFPRYYLH